MLHPLCTRHCDEWLRVKKCYFAVDADLRSRAELRVEEKRWDNLLLDEHKMAGAQRSTYLLQIPSLMQLFLFVCSPTSERRPSVGVVTIRSRYSLRRRAHSPVKTPSGVRRGQSRGLVSLGRHKLRRLSPSSSVTTPWSSRTGMFMNVHGKTRISSRVDASCKTGP